MKTGDEKCNNLSQKLKDSKYKVKKQRDDIEKRKKKLIHALGDTQDQVAINLKQEKKFAAAKAAANEVENKLKKQISDLLKSAPVMSKPVDISTALYAGYGKAAPPLITVVAGEKAEKLAKIQT